ncbi:hypothetical protein [Streptomyces sp. NPDC020983]|uniref:hypothetical protein n=1 Tax=Streptomyces sp. NPDC020983 TaxID=3365106 RepID=UPI00378B81FB
MTRPMYDRMYAALTAAQKERPKRQAMIGDEPEWVRYERDAMWAEVNAARAEAGLGPALLTDILRVEQQAVGHSDYTTKYALYCAELAEGVSR